jgi:hypothetical protein
MSGLSITIRSQNVFSCNKKTPQTSGASWRLTFPVPKAERKRKQVESAGHKSRQVKLIKLANKTSNLRAISFSPAPDWPVERRLEYVRQTFDVVVQVRGGSPWLDRNSMILQRTRKSLFITNDLDCDPSIRRHRTRALAQR